MWFSMYHFLKKILSHSLYKFFSLSFLFSQILFKDVVKHLILPPNFWMFCTFFPIHLFVYLFTKFSSYFVLVNAFQVIYKFTDSFFNSVESTGKFVQSILNLCNSVLYFQYFHLIFFFLNLFNFSYCFHVC